MRFYLTIFTILALIAVATGYYENRQPTVTPAYAADETPAAPDDSLPRVEMLSGWDFYNTEGLVTQSTGGYLHVVATIHRGDEYRDCSNESNYQVYLHPTQGYRLGCQINGHFVDLFRVPTLTAGGAEVMPDEVRVMDPNGTILYDVELTRALREIHH